MSKYHTIPRGFHHVQQLHFDGGKADKTEPSGEGSKLFDLSKLDSLPVPSLYSPLLQWYPQVLLHYLYGPPSDIIEKESGALTKHSRSES